jgi:hypothetical protein
MWLKVGHTVSSDGGETIVSRGICYNTSPNPTTSGNVSPSGFNNWVGSDTSFMYIIQPNTTYYIRAFAVNSKGTAYGNEVSFTTANVQLATLVTDPVSNFNFTPNGNVNAEFTGQLTNDGGQPPVLGFCYATSPNPSINDFTYGSSVGNFIGYGGDLIPNTTYYVRTYATNIAGTAYGNQVTFTTPQVQLATVETYPVTDLFAAPGPSYYTNFSGALTDNGGTPFTNWGFCYSTSPNPTTADILVDNYGSVSNLPIGQTFYVRAYATNAAGTAYGNEISFSTPAITLPEVITYPVTDISSNSATLNGEIINWGNDNWGGQNSGFYYGTSPNPTVNDSYIYLSGNILTGYPNDLQPSTTYYVRSFASNSAGEAYGNEISFTTLP